MLRKSVLLPFLRKGISATDCGVCTIIKKGGLEKDMSGNRQSTMSEDSTRRFVVFHFEAHTT